MQKLTQLTEKLTWFSKKTEKKLSWFLRYVATVSSIAMNNFATNDMLLLTLHSVDHL